MNIPDIILGIILIAGIIRGFVKGFIFEVAMLGALVVCYFLGFRLAGVVASFLSKHTGWNYGTLKYVSYFLVWAGISVGAWFLAKLFSGLADVVALGFFNKIAGAVFGGIKYAFLISLFLFFFNKADAKYRWINPDTKANSHLFYPLLKMSDWFIPFLRR